MNRPPEILESQLKNKHVIISSAEMSNLMKNLPLLIGDSVSVDDDVWQLILQLKKIIMICTATIVLFDTHIILRHAVRSYLHNLTDQFRTYSLKPKHHFLIHYATIMEAIGPLWNICCMRFEAKHSEGKKISNSTTSRVNVCKTIAIRSQLMLNYRFLSFSEYERISVALKKEILITEINGFSYFRKLLNVELSKKIWCTRMIIMHGKQILCVSVLATFEENQVDFDVIQHIIHGKKRLC